MKSNRYVPSLVALEPRALMTSVLPAAFVGPLTSGQTRGAPPVPDGMVTAMSISPTTLVLGNSATATLTVAAGGNVAPGGTTWTYTVFVAQYGGVTSPVASAGGGALTSSFWAMTPGTYTVTAVTSYTFAGGGDQQPPPGWTPPAPTTTTGSIAVAPPDTVTKAGGNGVPTPWNAAIQLSDNVTAGGKPLGKRASGTMEEQVPPTTWWDGEPFHLADEWGPPAPSLQFNLTNSVLYDQMKLNLPEDDWAEAPVGETLVAFNQNLRYVWQMTGTNSAGVEDNYLFTAPLNSLDWAWVKVSFTQWEAN